MSTLNNDALDRIENRLRAEAREFVKKQSTHSGTGTDGRRLVAFLTGIDPVNKESREQAGQELMRKLAAERRTARKWRAGYDLNRHISLSRALDYLRSDRPADAHVAEPTVR